MLKFKNYNITRMWLKIDFNEKIIPALDRKHNLQKKISKSY